MRITHNSQYIGFTRNLDSIQTRKNKEQVKLSTGKDIINLSDDPQKVVDVKLADKKISQNEKYIEMLDITLSELYFVDESIEFISNYVDQIRTESIDVISQEPPAIQVMGQKFRGMLDDLIRIGNRDFNGHFVFAGTKTTPNSITPENPINAPLPFELITEEGTPDNPSGLRVVFHGNNDDRIINKDQKTTEVINKKSDELFGQNLEVFNLVIDMHNTLIYTPDGSKRTDKDILTRDEIQKINKIQSQLRTYGESINRIAANNGTTIQRVDNVYQQIVDENIRLKDFRSLREDTNVAEATINLKKEENALNYALQVGARINQTTLFDFLR